MADELNLSTLKPAQSRKDRKRVGRGWAGQGPLLRPRHQGPEVSRGLEEDAGRLRGRPDADRHAAAEAARQHLRRRDADWPVPDVLQPINLRDLDRVFEDGDTVNVEALVEKGLLKNTKADVKILGTGELKKKLAVTAHFSASAREDRRPQAGARPRSRTEGPAQEEGKAKPKPRRRRARGSDRGRGDRGRGPPRRSRLVQLARQRLARSGAPAPRPLHGDDPRDLPPGLVDPARASTRRRSRATSRDRAARSSACSTSSRAARSRSSRSSRSGSCRTSPPRSSSS